MRKVAISLIALLFGFVLVPGALADTPYSQCQGWYNSSAGSASGSSCVDAEYNLYMSVLAYNHGCPGPYYQPCNIQIYPDPYSSAPVCQGDCGEYVVTGFFGYGCEICVHPDCMP